MSLNLVTNVGKRTCGCCKRLVPVLSFRFMDVDVEVAACPRCDDLTPKPWVPKETP